MRIGMRRAGGGLGLRRPESMLGTLGLFVVAGAVTLAVLAVVGTFLVREAATREGISDAEQTTHSLAHRIVEPLLTEELLAGNSAALRGVDDAVRPRLAEDGVLRLKLWNPNGQIVYSDEPRLIGETYPLDRDELAMLGTGRVDAEVSDLSRDENTFERPQGRLLEVYVPVRSSGGTTMLLEAYYPYSMITESGEDLVRVVAPILVSALLILGLVQVLTAGAVLRRLRRGQREREALLLRAVEASDAERRRIAADLHDGVVQHLTGTSLVLATEATEIERGRSSAEPVVLLREAATQVRHSVRALRSLFVEIYPPNLHTAGLVAALTDLLAPLAARGVQTTHAVSGGLVLPRRVEALVYRVAQEVLRNVAKHADARRVHLELASVGSALRLSVTDDGNGCSSDRLAEQAAAGHLGLRLLEELARDAGGTFVLDSAPGRGTSAVLTVPGSRHGTRFPVAVIVPRRRRYAAAMASGRTWRASSRRREPADVST